MRIFGTGVDDAGRCCHYHSEVDVVANKCATCHTFWACHLCHDEAADHPFGRMDRDQPAVMCGVCGAVMNYHHYHAHSTPRCPRCGHGFNPGCVLHEDLYFQPMPPEAEPEPTDGAAAVTSDRQGSTGTDRKDSA